MKKLEKKMRPQVWTQGFAVALILAISACSNQISSGISPQAPTLSQPAALSVPVSSEINRFGLSPRNQDMVKLARQYMQTPAFLESLRLGAGSQFSVQNLKQDFSIQAKRDLTPRMYAALSNNQLYEIDPSTYAITALTTGLVNNMYGLARDPISNDVFYMKDTAPYTLYKWNRTTNTHTAVGDLPVASGNTLYRLGFAPSGELYLANNQGLFVVDTSNAQIMSVMTAAEGVQTGTGGDLAVNAAGKIYMAINKIIYLIDPTAKTSTQIGNFTNMSGNISGMGFTADDRLLVTSLDSKIYEITNYTTSPAAVERTVLSGVTNAVDLSSAVVNACPVMTAGRPDYPTLLFNDDFSTMPANFANLAGETNPDTSSGWLQWNTDYYPTGKGVLPWNPGPGQATSLRNIPGEYASTPGDPRPNMLETAISRKVPLKYKAGDKLIAKLKVAPTFSDQASDTTLMITFDDPSETVAVSSTIRGDKASGGELYVEAVIPSCATEATVIGMAYLGENETSSVTFEKASLEFIPQNYYTQTTLLNEPFDTSTTHATYGTNFPAGMDEQFGAYDLYTVANWPTTPGDLAVTAANPNAASGYGGLVKRVNLPTYTSTDSISAKLFTASTFTDAASEASLLIDFFNAADQKLGSLNATKVTAKQWRWLQIDRGSIPSGATYAKIVPILSLGASETGSLLWDRLEMSLTSTQPPAPPTSLVLNSPSSGSFTTGDSIALKATPDKVLSGMSVLFVDGSGNTLATGTKQMDGSFTASWTAATAGSYTVIAQAKDLNGNLLLSSSPASVTVVAPSISITAPSSGWSIVRNSKGGSLSLSATATGVPSGGSVKFEIQDSTGTVISTRTATNTSGNIWDATWGSTNTRANYDVYAKILNASGTTLATAGPISGSVN
ncbi:hypothetical protein COW36_01615 [bacterium (Candidatus Blackallbacteria) CG17_big_fil_post_rev_8_21_14_2_50_48_46]|uniref:Uncharacterized protein n=1 Tax=bacterium (Candidatus Blackallbacteria) CG17_big_fil_post_rev_8_21_14_2_50_48_46 TaxID=2014261 RepID=A0A2M7GC94_9BACT|nr:MAG: hypothetical protein COW64_09560 [bacterium (Candidatus Blackallbacteria) CG18_big_fil_WC_8_21_14_2_50_49_26]PIW19563.1 MAG: hypothetical protein COW36_01615 [bacterium (Candidatus Blackallbacteria) CG17_big_fil_post_rev_8_21_14_2_50_48_46]PIW48834.1 MAG: hypothetical protein COW20_06840 [bacterium (Candidatus Blackallbacteria) CG13_big_fil_rev_8_21_14_2_50_49_14]